MQKERRKDFTKRELVERLRVLRSDIDTVIDHFHINCTARVEEMLRVLERREMIGDDESEPEAQSIQRMLSILDGVKLKPRKGRLKDLKRVVSLLDELASLFQTRP